MAYKVGTAQINVHPDLGGFREKLEDQWRRQMRGFNKDKKNQLKVDVDKDHLKESLDKAGKQIDGFVKRKRTIDVTARFNSRSFKKQVKEALNSVESGIKASADTSDAEKKLSKAAAKRTVKFDLDDSALDTYMRNRRKLGIATIDVELRGDADAENRLNSIARTRNVDIKINKIGNEKLDIAKSTTANVNLLADIPAMRAHVEAVTRARPVKVYGKLVVDTREARKHIEAWSAKRQPSIHVGIDLDSNSASAAFDKLDRKLDKKLNVKVSTAQARSELDELMVKMGTIGNLMTRMAFMGGIFTSAGIGAAGATPAVAAFGSAVGSMAKTALLAPAGIGALASSFAALKIGTAGLFGKEGMFGEKGAVASLASLADQGKLTAEEFDLAAEGMTEGATTFLHSLFDAEEGADSFYQSLKKVQEVSQNQLFEGLNTALDTVKNKLTEVRIDGVTNLDLLSEEFRGMNDIFGDTVANWASLRFSENGFVDLLTQLENTKRGLAQLSVATMNWSKMWNDVSTVGSAFLPGIASGVEGITRDMANWANEARSTGRLYYMISGGIETAKTMGESAASAFRIMGDVLHAAGMNAQGMADSISGALEKVESFTSSMQGQSSMSSFFEDAKAVGSEMMQTFGALGSMLAEHVVPIMAEFTKGIGPGLRDAIAGSSPLLDAIAPSARGIGEAVGRAAQGFQEFGRMVAPIVQGVLPPLVGMLKTLAPAIGGLAAPTVTILTLASALKKLQPVGAALTYMFGGPKGLPAQFLAMGVAVTSMTGTLAPLISAAVSLNDSLGGLPATMVGLLAIAKQFGAPFSSLVSNVRNSVGAFSSLRTSANVTAATLAPIPTHIIATRNSLNGISPALSKVSSGIATTGKSIGSLRDRFTVFTAGKRPIELMAQSVGGLRDKFTLLTAGKTDLHLRSIAGAGTVATAAFSKMSAAASTAGKSLLAMFGGPVGVAAMATIATITQVTEGISKYNKYVETSTDLSNKMRSASSDMFNALAQGASPVATATDMLQEYTDGLSEIENINLLGKLDANLGRFTEAIGLNSSELSDNLQAQQDAYTAAQDYKDALSNLGLTTEDVAKKATGSRQEWTAFKEELKANGVWDSTISDLDRYADAISSAVKSFNDLGPNGNAVKKAMDELAESAGMATGDLEKFTDAMSELNGSSTSAVEATANLTETLNDIDAATLGIDFTAFDQATGKIDPTTAAGAALVDVLGDIKGDLLDVAENGGNIDEAFSQAEPTLRNLASAAGMSWEQMEALLGQMGMMPDTIKTNVQVLTDDAARNVTAIKNSLDGVKQGEWTAPLNVTNQDALDAIRETGVQLKDLGNGNYQFKIDADDTQAQAKVLAVQSLFARLGTEKATAVLDANIDPLMAGAMAASNFLNYNLQDKTIHIGEQGAASAIDMAGKLGWKVTNLPDGSVQIEAGSVTNATGLVEQLGIKTREGKNGTVLIEDSSTQAAIDLLVVLGAAVRDPKTGEVTINNEDGPGVLQNLRDINASIGNKYQEIVTTHKDIYVTTQSGNDYNRMSKMPGFSSNGGMATGGRVPGYADGDRHPGYRIPTSGPGTSIVDGFGAVDSNGIPVARLDAGEWVINGNSSEKYDKELAAINAGVFPKLPGFAEGGTPKKRKSANMGEALLGAATGFGTGLAKGVASSNIATSVRNATGVTGTGSTVDDEFASVDALAQKFTELPEIWTEASSELAAQWDTLASTANNVFGGLEASVSASFGNMNLNASASADSLNANVSASFGNLNANVTTSWGNTATSLSGSMAQLDGNFQAGTASIQANWGNTSASMQATYSNGMVPVFTALTGSVNQQVTGFQQGAAGIGTAWNNVRENTAAPVRYAIGTVFNNGLIGMWNSASEILGLQSMSPYPVAFATGGPVQGPGTETSDDIPAMLSDGEYVIRAKAVKKIGIDNLNALNSGNVAFAANAFRDKTFKEVAIKRASGGPVKGTQAWNQLKRGYDWARSRSGRPYVWGGSANGAGGTDCSGYMSGIADVILGGDGTRQWATMSFPGGQQGAWGPGLGAGFAVGISDGHTAGTIGGVDGMPAVNVESGGSNGGVSFGGPNAVGADDGQFNRQYHMLVGGGGAFKPGLGRSGGVSVAQLVAQATKESTAKLDAAIAGFTGPGLVSQVPKASGTEQKNAAQKKIDAAVSELQAAAGAGNVDLSGVDGTVVQQVQEVFKRHGWTGDQWDAASWIIGKESGWNPSAVNPSSGAYGLFQFLGSTKDQYLPGPDYSVPTQANAGARYIKDRYGNPISAKAFWQANNWYETGGYLQPGVTIAKNGTGKPEPVFNSDQWNVLKENIAASGNLIESIRDKFTTTQNTSEDSSTSDEDEPVFKLSDYDRIGKSLAKKLATGDIKGLIEESNELQGKLVEVVDKVDWEEVGKEIGKAAVDGFVDGQLDDINGVLGTPDWESIPLVSANSQLQESLGETRRKEAEDAKRAAEEQAAQAEADKQNSSNVAEEASTAALEAVGVTSAEDTTSATAVKAEEVQDKKDQQSLVTGLVNAQTRQLASIINPDYGNYSSSGAQLSIDPQAVINSALGVAKTGAQVALGGVAGAANLVGQAVNLASPVLSGVSMIDPTLGAAVKFAATGVGSAASMVGGVANGVSNGLNSSGTSGGSTFNIYASSVDEGMRRAGMYDRQTAARADSSR